MTSQLRIENIGDLWDIAVGPDENSMVGYVIATNGQFQQSTDIQDEQHLVQIASPSNVDRYQRYPQVSQGDWSGGERQLIFVNANQYYSSSQLDTSKPGHLRILGAYTLVTLPNTAGTPLPRSMAANAIETYVAQYNNNAFAVIDHLSLVVGSVTVAANPIEIIRGGDAMYASIDSHVYQISDPFARAVAELTSDGPNTSGTTMAYFNGSIWYGLQATLLQLHSATYPLGSSAGTLETTMPAMETSIIAVCDSPSGLVIVTGDAVGGLNSYIYSFDGVNQIYLGAIAGFVMDAVNANGTVYLLASTGVGSTTNAQALPIIYEVTGSTISTFDDFREVDPAFYPLPNGEDNASGHLASDGLYLYLFWFGLRTKRYLLSTGAVYDVGWANYAARFGVQFGTPTIQGGWVEGEHARDTVVAVQPLIAPASGTNGVMTTSYFDFGVPTTNKLFNSIRFEMNSPTPPVAASLSVAFRTDNETAFTNVTPQLSLSSQSLICVLPQGTIGNRIQFQITLLGAQNPDINSYSVKATLARVFQVDLACMYNQTTRNGEPDPQGLSSQALIANLENIKSVYGGECVLWVPDATALDANGQPLGYVQINAELQDYQHKTPQTRAGYADVPDGVRAIEAVVSATFTEVLG